MIKSADMIVFEIDQGNIIVEGNKEAYFVFQDYLCDIVDWEFSDWFGNKYRIIGDRLYRLEWKEVGKKV